MGTERETTAWTGCTRAQLDRSPGMSTWWDAPLTSRSLTSMQSLRVVPQRRLASCPAPSSILQHPPLTWTWLPKSEKTLCLKSGKFPLWFLSIGSRNHTLICVHIHFLIYRKREEEKKREVLTNPVKMKKIKEMVNMLSIGLKYHCFYVCFVIQLCVSSQLRQNLDKKDKKKRRKKDKKDRKGDKERKKEKKHKRRSSSSEEEDVKKHRSGIE